MYEWGYRSMRQRKIGTIRRKLKTYRALMIAAAASLLAFPVAKETAIEIDGYQLLLNGKPIGIVETAEV